MFIRNGFKQERISYSIHNTTASVANDIIATAKRGLFDALVIGRRGLGKVEEMKMEDLVKKVKKETEDYPFETLPLPRLISRRPKFVG